MRKLWLSLTGLGVVLIISSGIYVFSVWNQNSRVLERYQLILAGRVTVTGTTMSKYLDVRTAMTKAEWIGSFGVILGLMFMVAGLWTRTNLLEHNVAMSEPKKLNRVNMEPISHSKTQRTRYEELSATVEPRPTVAPSGSSDSESNITGFWAPDEWRTRLRWFAFLPASLVVAVIFETIISILRILLGDGFVGGVVTFGVVCLEGPLYVITGMEIAPSYRRQVALILLAVEVALLITGCGVGWISNNQVAHWGFFLFSSGTTAWRAQSNR